MPRAAPPTKPCRPGPGAWARAASTLLGAWALSGCLAADLQITAGGDGDASADVDDDCACGAPVLACAAASTVSVDGDTGDWRPATAQAIAATRWVSLLDSAAPADDADCSAAVFTAWDLGHVYVLVRVQDETVMDDSPALSADDGVEVYVDGGHERAAVNDSNDLQFLVSVGNEADGAVEAATGYVHAVATSGSGYDVELAIPWAALGGGASAGRAIGFDVAINDDDDGGARDSQLVGHGDGSGASSPRQLGQLWIDATPCGS